MDLDIILYQCNWRSIINKIQEQYRTQYTALRNTYAHSIITIAIPTNDYFLLAYSQVKDKLLLWKEIW